MRGTAFRWGAIGLGTFVAFWLSGCGYNALQGNGTTIEVTVRATGRAQASDAFRAQ